jgi:DNA-binding MarR family transcriptional regulator
MLEQTLSLPKFLDVLLVLNDNITYTRIYRLLPRCADYLTRGLKYLKDHDLITIENNPNDARAIVIKLTPKGRDAQKMLLTLYNIVGEKEEKNVNN